MQRPRPEDNDGAARTRSQKSLPQVDVIVLSADPALLATLCEASGLAHQIFHAESAEAAVDLLIGGHCGLFIVDVAVVRGNVVDLIEKLQAQFPEVLLLATGRREEQHAVASLVSNGRVYRFLHKPISPARAELFLSAATRRYGELHPHDARSNLASGPLATPRNRATLLLAAALAVLVGIGAWWWTSGSGLEPQVASQPNPAPVPAPAELLAREQAIATLEQNMDDALAARDAPRARNAFTALQRAAPDHPRLDELEAALFALARQASAAAAKQESKRSAPPPPPQTVRSRAPARVSAPIAETAPSSQNTVANQKRVVDPIHDEQPVTQRAAIHELLDHAISLRQRGQLIEPQGDNAVEALQAALAAAPSSDDVNTERQRLSVALLDHTRTALAAGEVDRADVLATRAEEILPGLPQTKALREQIGAARTQREAATSVLQAATLKRTREVPAVYPREARLSSIEGWVDLEFTISAEGVPSDIAVRASEPRRVFDAAAAQALRQWRFAPIARDATPRRALLRMEFKLQR